MKKVFAKRNLGQHFLKDKGIAARITSSLSGEHCNSVLEIGPGMGILTQFLLERDFEDFRVIEIDNECVYYLKTHYPGLKNIIAGDFLKLDIERYFNGKIAIIGNFPYNISSQIFFRILDHRQKVTEVVGMLQKEVAERICADPGSRVYGILSVLVQAFYETEFLFTVPDVMFIPIPRVNSGVIRLWRNKASSLDCDEDLFFKVVKACFNQRRKTLRNSIRSAFGIEASDYRQFSRRPEELSVEQFVELTNWIEKEIKRSE